MGFDVIASGSIKAVSRVINSRVQPSKSWVLIRQSPADNLRLFGFLYARYRAILHQACVKFGVADFDKKNVFLDSRGSSEHISSSLRLVFCRVATVKRLPVHNHSAGYIFSDALGSLGLF